MSRVTDQTYLRGQQYKTSANLAARADLHRRFSTNATGWLPWVFEQLALTPGQRVLEVGGGPGWLLRENVHRLPAGLRLTVSDYSPGMVAEATGQLRVPGFVGDAQALPLPPARFDVGSRQPHAISCARPAARRARVGTRAGPRRAAVRRHQWHGPFA